MGSQKLSLCPSPESPNISCPQSSVNFWVSVEFAGRSVLGGAWSGGFCWQEGSEMSLISEDISSGGIFYI